jgi:hypothetical protein
MLDGGQHQHLTSNMDTPKADLLGRIPMFAELETAVLDALAQRAISRAYEQGHVLFHEGDPCEGVYVMSSPGAKSAYSRHPPRAGN